MDEHIIKKDREESQRIVEELHDLEQFIAANTDWDKSKDNSLALLKVFKGLGEEDWKGISSRFNVDSSWLSFSLDGKKFSTLIKLLETISNLSLAKDRDPLTGLNNRGFFQRVLSREMEKSFSYKVPLTLAVMDIDDFKVINDTHGHVCGDQVIKDLASILSNEIRSGDYAARIGGEEFALILPGTGKVKSEPLLNRILSVIRNGFSSCSTGKVKIPYTISLGAATYRGKAQLRVEELLAQADKELYKVKNSGKNSLKIVSAVEMVDEKSMVRRDEKDFLLKG